MCVLRVTIEIGTTIVKIKISLTGSLAFQMTEKALTRYTYPGRKLILASITYSGTIRLTLGIFFLFFSVAVLAHLSKPYHSVYIIEVTYEHFYICS